MDNFRRNLLMDSGGGGTDPSQAAPLEVAFYNGSYIVIRKQENWQDDETPIGIVVVPGYHNRYGDGSCGVMSLVGMDYNHPENGEPITSSSQSDSITMFYGINYFVENNMFVGSGYEPFTSGYYIPYQIINGSESCRTSFDDGYALWPYEFEVDSGFYYPLSSANTTYSNSGTYPYVSATSGNAGCDFNGIRNTAALYVKTRTASQWTASTVTNATGTTNAPAAACCGRFKTVGTNSFLDVFSGITSNNLNYGTSDSTKTNKGFWYFPAIGELTYLPSKRFQINNTITALNQKYGNVAIQVRTDRGFWGSTCYYNYSFYMMNLEDGYIEVQDSNTYCRVRAFMRL